MPPSPRPTSAVSLRIDAAIIRRLFRDALRGQIIAFACAAACMVIVAAATAALAWMMRHIVNDVLLARDEARMWLIAVAVLAATLAKGFAEYGSTVLLARVGNRLVSQLQCRLYDKILAMSLGDITQSHSAKLMSRLVGHANAARNVLTRAATNVGRDLLTVIFLLAVMFAQDALMGLAVLVIGPLAILGLRRINARLRELSAREIANAPAVVQSLQETVQGFRMVKSYTAETIMRDRFVSAVDNNQTRADRMVRIRAWTSPIMEGVGGIIISALILFSGWQAIATGKTPGQFMAFLGAFLLAYEPAKRLATSHVLMQQDLVGVRKMYEFLDAGEAEPLSDSRPGLAGVRGEISLSGVSFGYRPGKPVLKNVSLRATPGETIALVGPSGVGKSTLINLLQGFHEAWSGEIRIDGTDIGTVNRASLRRAIAVVSQDQFVLSATIRQNIALGRPQATDAEIAAAAAAAHALDFITALPHGFDTLLSERGINLSGGQLQRIAIARAILKDAPILILDEATSALDEATERQVQAALRRLMAGRTALVIAHRRSTIENADRVFLLADGELVTGATRTADVAEAAQP